MTGDKIRQFRQAKNKTLSEVADQVGISTSSLSQIERGLISPSMATFRKIAKALDVPPFVLFIESPEEELVIRKGNRNAFVSDGVRMEVITTGQHPAFEMLSVSLAPGQSLGDKEAMDYGRGESMVIMTGTVEAQIGDDVFQLEDGDSIYFPPSLAHNVKNIGDSEAIMISVVEKAYMP
ncbi:MAG: helix-turn-helix transcriptional regulator [Anaerolineales bacterium]|nr:helix-turn-helix transcriptional regulator [Anaerolineales bacterium]